MKKIIILIFFLVYNFSFSQNIHTGFYSNAHILKLDANPSIFPDKDFVISLPFLNSNFSFNSPITFNNFFLNDNNDSLKINLPHILSNLDKNEINIFSSRIDILNFHIGFKFGNKKKYYVYISDKLINDFSLQFSNKFINFISNGNASSLNKINSFNNEKFNNLSYNSLNLGFAYSDNKNFSIGTRFKFLNGLINIDSRKLNLNSYTDSLSNPIYQTTLTSNILLNTSGINSYLDNQNFNLDFNPFLNNGFAFDFGFNYNYKKWQFNSSITDIGKLNWDSENSTSYSTGGEVNFILDGIQINSSENTDISNEFQTLSDSLLSVMRPVNTEKSYTTNLNRNIFLSTKYNFDKKNSVSILFHNRALFNYNFNSFIISYQCSVSKKIQLLSSYLNTNKISNLSFGTVYTSDILQIHFILDNVLLFDVLDTRNFAFQFGLNFNFSKS